MHKLSDTALSGNGISGTKGSRYYSAPAARVQSFSVASWSGVPVQPKVFNNDFPPLLQNCVRRPSCITGAVWPSSVLARQVLPVSTPPSVARPSLLSSVQGRVAAIHDRSLDAVLTDYRQGLTAEQLRYIMEIVRSENVVAAFRFVPRGVQNFWGEKVIGKPRKIAAHTSVSGPCISLVPRNESLRPPKKGLTRQSSGLEKLIRKGEVKTEPLVMSEDQLRELIRLGAVKPAETKELKQMPPTVRLSRPKSSYIRFSAEAKADGRYEIFVFNKSGVKETLEVVVNPKGQRFVSDMDPVLIGVPEDRWDEGELDKPSVSMSRLDNGSESGSDSDIQAMMDKEFGNITPRAQTLFSRINVKLEMELIRHGPESLNPYAQKENLFPCLVFNPSLVKGVPQYSIINSLEDMSHFMSACRKSNIKIPPNPKWKRIGYRRGSFYEAVIAKDLPKK